VRLLNLEPDPQGLIPYAPFELAFAENVLTDQGIELDFPFPQMFVGSRVVFVMTRTRVFLALPEDLSNTLTELPVYDADTGSLTSIDAGGPWHLCDMDQAWYMTNGVNILYFNYREIMIGTTPSNVYVKKGFTSNTMTSWKGRIVMGGFDYNTFWNSDWKALFNEWDAKKVDTGMKFEVPKQEGNILAPMEQNFYWYSVIGGGDVLPLFFKTLFENSYLSGSGYSSTRPYIFDLWRQGGGGFGYIPVNGAIQNILPLGQFLIAYSEGGAVALEHHVQPTPVIAPRIPQGVFPVAIHNMGAVAGDNLRHVMVDKDCRLWQLGADLQLSELDYQGILEPYKGQHFTVQYADNRFYISTNTVDFVLTPNGLLETKQQMTSVVSLFNKARGLGSDLPNDVAGVSEGEVVIDLFSHGLVGDKRIESVSLIFREDYIAEHETVTTQVAIDYRFKKREDWTRSAFYPVNDQGYVKITCEGLEHRVVISINNYERMYLNEVLVEITHSDKRYTRSVDISQLNF
jgi:hypothetical protein